MFVLEKRKKKITRKKKIALINITLHCVGITAIVLQAGRRDVTVSAGSASTSRGGGGGGGPSGYRAAVVVVVVSSSGS